MHEFSWWRSRFLANIYFTFPIFVQVNWHKRITESIMRCKFEINYPCLKHLNVNRKIQSKLGRKNISSWEYADKNGGHISGTSLIMAWICSAFEFDSNACIKQENSNHFACNLSIGISSDGYHNRTIVTII